MKLKVNFILWTVGALVILSISSACDLPIRDRHEEEGARLALEIHEFLKEENICSSPMECKKLFSTYRRHGNKVNLNIYGVNNKKSNEAVLKVFELVLNRGVIITDGVPITIRVFSKSREEYGSIIPGFGPKPIVTLEAQ